MRGNGSSVCVWKGTMNRMASPSVLAWIMVYLHGEEYTHGVRGAILSLRVSGSTQREGEETIVSGVRCISVNIIMGLLLPGFSSNEGISVKLCVIASMEFC